MQHIPGERYIEIGLQGEHDAREVQFDISGLIDRWPQAVWRLMYRRPGDTAPYPGEITQADAMLIWHIQRQDVQAAGTGQYQLIGTQIGADGAEMLVAKSPIGTVLIHDSLGCEVPPPDAIVTWLEEIDKAAQAADASASAAEASATQSQNSAATAETLAQQASNSAQLAAQSADDAADSAVVAQEHAQNAGDSATKAEQSETRAQLSATAAQQYASQAQGSASAAAQSATAAKTSEDAAGESRQAAAQSEQAAKASEQAATQSAAAAKSSVDAAAQSEQAAKSSADAAAQSEQAASTAQQAVAALVDGIAQELTAQEILAQIRREVELLEQIAASGGSAGDLNGFSFALGEGGELIISYTNPEDESDVGSAVFATDSLGAQIAGELAAINGHLRTMAGTEG